MKRIVRMILLFAGACAAFAQVPTNSIVPNSNANVEGNSSMSEPLDSPSFRYQQVFDASQFAALAGNSGRVDSIWFRLDGATMNSPLLFFGGASVTLSTTTRTPDSLSPVFADNVGADAATIFVGAMSFGGTPQSGASPQPFRQTIIATAPFWYLPSQGNLLLDIAGAGGQIFTPGSLDAHFASGDSISRVFALNGNSLAGTPDTLGLVTRFDMTAVPEPATWLLAALAVAIMFVIRRR